RESGRSISSPPIKALELRNKENGYRSKPPKETSIVDPSWEYIDPTPDIHALFVQFDIRFFWGKLKNVEVRWSPRMTSCAGVCCYEGRGGLCSVRLSLPLLKLRPRKDLVETLLHEMIHAYLFVTHNNRDRDGHGPEFHKHMNRINNEAGTKITVSWLYIDAFIVSSSFFLGNVYHSFHDEVKLYQQHWWRCDGPCQKRPPYFGMVKRAMDRAPGPTDFWWKDHQERCGGRYIKVREPEGFSKKKTKQTDTKVTHPPTEKNDIRTFFPFHGKGNTLGSSSNISSGITSSKSHSPLIKTNPSNVTAFKDLSNKHKKGSGPKKAVSSANNGNKRPGGFGGMLANRGGGTLVITAKGTKSEQVINENKSTTPVDGSNKGVKGVANIHTINGNTNRESASAAFTPFGGKGHTLGGSGVSRLLNTKSETVTSKVNKHNGFSNGESKSRPSNKAKSPSLSPQKSQQHLDSWISSSKKKAEDNKIRGKFDAGQSNVARNSSVSPQKSLRTVDNWTLDNKRSLTSSEQSQFSDVSTSPSGGKAPKRHISIAENADDMKKLRSGSFMDLSETESGDMVNCPVCNSKIREVNINTHLDSCIEADVTDNGTATVKDCAVKFAPDCGVVKCPACNADTLKRDLEGHLEECLQSVFGKGRIVDDDEEDDWATKNSVDKKSGDNIYPCPCCLTMVKDVDMNAHLDVCLSAS
ncbi:hypothetical protein ANN_05171, partial [Periplaneta americana]